ncbi:carbohydrate ABC transporter permease [Treponema sp.]|jgi:ABC-type glycerol-3-phosphate transport system permease component
MKIQSDFKSYTQIIVSFLLILIAITMILPLSFMVLTSMRSMKEYMRNPIGFPTRIAIENYKSLYSGYPILSGLRNSFIVAIAALTISVTIAVPAAYAFAKLHIRWLKTVYLFILSLMMVPIMVTILPRYILFSKIGLIDTLFVLILSYTGTSLPYTVYLISSGFKGIPDELLEAGRIDGANYFQVILNVVLPMGKPSLIAVCILNFVNYWNELLQALMFINRESLKPITAIVSTLSGRFVANMPLMMAGLFLATIPVVLVYMFFERHIVAGVTMGSSK